MPESPLDKLYSGMIDPPDHVTPCALDYAELDVTTNFSFLRGASHPDEMVYTAAMLGYRAIAITDINSLAGVVRAWEAAQKPDLKLIVGARLVFTDAPDLLVWPTNRTAYGRLCRLLTTGRRRAPKGECHLQLCDFLECSEGFHAAADLSLRDVAQREEAEAQSSERRAQNEEQEGLRLSHSFCALRSELCASLHLLRDTLGTRLSLVASAVYGSDDQSHLARLAQISREFHIPLLATNAVHYHDPARRALQDVLTCVREGCTIHDAGFKLFPNGERYL